MYKIAVIGDRDSVYGFAALGLETYFETEPKSAIRIIRTLENEGCAIIYITEKLYSLILDEAQRLSKLPMPALIPIPGVSGNTGIGKKALEEAILKAVGSEV